ncbi:Septin [Rhizoclosmatium globosum]|uniref:Septin n=1 Tax=Rhizoclosmatium globosum TaxID=329046 RepID=A0A1Y2BZ40_9FUNG|nr:Septin [Rhizoclosmatium globosum]|eukprot:ORY39335.1 Septin [Rhizoclosmatium globosum]
MSGVAGTVPVVKKNLNGIVGFHNLPNQVHRKSVKKGFHFTIMIVGESGLGKSTLINTLFNAPIAPTRDGNAAKDQQDSASKTVEINSFTSDIEENGVKLKLTVIDTPGFGDFINNTEAHKPILKSIEERYENYLDQESRVNRKNMTDNRVHACIYFIAPTGHSLKQLDVQFMKELGPKVNLIPVIAKSDVLTEAEVTGFKERILQDIKANNIQIYYPAVHENDDPETVQEIKEIISRIPFAIVGSNQTFEHPPGSKNHIRGRKYPWGLIEIDNEAHCDFVKLRQMLIRSHMEELKEHTTQILYESHRSLKLEGAGVRGKDAKTNPAKFEEEKRAHELKMAKMEQEMKAVFQQKVSEKEKKLKQSEEELYARHKEMKQQLEQQRLDLEERKKRLLGGASPARANSNTPTQQSQKGKTGLFK